MSRFVDLAPSTEPFFSSFFGAALTGAALASAAEGGGAAAPPAAPLLAASLIAPPSLRFLSALAFGAASLEAAVVLEAFTPPSPPRFTGSFFALPEWSTLPPRSGTAPIFTVFTNDFMRLFGPETRAVTARANTLRLTAKALHSESGGASLAPRRQPAHMRESTSALFRWPAAGLAFSPAIIDCTVTSRRRSKICRRKVYSFLNDRDASRMFICCMRDQPPFSAGRLAARGTSAGASFAVTASAMAVRPSFSAPSPAAVPARPWRLFKRSVARVKLFELSTAVVTPSRCSPGRSAQSATAPFGPASAGKSKPRRASRRAVMRSEQASTRSAPRQGAEAVGEGRSRGKR
mmetsp:Transcript_34426/g.73316  ORF Transcript_34426/g.73316 Transcript_34426/m.73316 type:complete len:348 (-) Transcript_34426:1654-2697(-)